MPTSFKNAKYYNLVNTLLDPELLTKYTKEINPSYLIITENPQLLTFNLSPLEIKSMYIYRSRGIQLQHPPIIYKKQHFVYNKNRVDFYSVWDRLDKDMLNTILSNYIDDLWCNKHICKYGDYDQVIKLLKKLVKNNTYNIRTMLMKGLCDAYFNKYIASSVIKAIAINKIKRNELYYCGLAKKLSMRECGMY